MKNLNIKNELNIDQAKPAKSNTPLGVQLNPNWVTGFMDGEGSFIIAILPSTGPLKNKISLRISITQKAHSKIVLFYLQKFFDCGAQASNTFLKRLYEVRGAKQGGYNYKNYTSF